MNLTIDLLHQYTRLLDSMGANKHQILRITTNNAEQFKKEVQPFIGDEKKIVFPKPPIGYDCHVSIDGYELFFFANIKI